jgi:DNA-binding NarL/FixJ family response regulator
MNNPYDVLTVREKHIFDFMAQMFTHKEIAVETGLSAKTVKFHISNIYRKLGIGDELNCNNKRLLFCRQVLDFQIKEEFKMTYDLRGHCQKEESVEL